jgi:hypothetical protein
MGQLRTANKRALRALRAQTPKPAEKLAAPVAKKPKAAAK